MWHSVWSMNVGKRGGPGICKGKHVVFMASSTCWQVWGTACVPWSEPEKQDRTLSSRSSLDVVVHTCNPGIWKAEAGGSRAGCQPWLHSEMLSPKNVFVFKMELKFPWGRKVIFFQTVVKTVCFAIRWMLCKVIRTKNSCAILPHPDTLIVNSPCICSADQQFFPEALETELQTARPIIPKYPSMLTQNKHYNSLFSVVDNHRRGMFIWGSLWLRILVEGQRATSGDGLPSGRVRKPHREVHSDTQSLEM